MDAPKTLSALPPIWARVLAALDLGGMDRAQLERRHITMRLDQLVGALRAMISAGLLERSRDIYRISRAGRDLLATGHGRSVYMSGTWTPPAVVRRDGSDDWRSCPSRYLDELRPWRSP